jgi:hypothetical protein
MGMGMSKPEPIISKFPPSDGRNWECQCARCGSSADFETCSMCGGDGWVDDRDGWYDDDEDDADDDMDGDSMCQSCASHGGGYRCLSSPKFCQDNPIAGREATKRGLFEWFIVEQRGNNT